MASEFALVGTTPRNVRRDRLGVFKERPAQLVNGRPSYQLEGSGQLMMWFAGSAWRIGTSENVGKAVGAVKAKDQAQRPELITATWQVGDEDNKTWVPAPGLRCISGAALHAERQAAASTFVIMGATPSSKHQSRMGLYKKRAQLVNGWPSYEAAFDDGKYAMWHAGYHWFVGLKADLGKNRGFLAALDGALRPEAIAAK